MHVCTFVHAFVYGGVVAVVGWGTKDVSPNGKSMTKYRKPCIRSAFSSAAAGRMPPGARELLNLFRLHAHNLGLFAYRNACRRLLKFNYNGKTKQRGVFGSNMDLLQLDGSLGQERTCNLIHSAKDQYDSLQDDCPLVARC